MGEYLKDCTYIKSLADDVADMSETMSINPNDKTNYWLMAVILLASAWLILLVVIIVEYYMKCGLTIPYLLSY